LLSRAARLTVIYYTHLKSRNKRIFCQKKTPDCIAQSGVFTLVIGLFDVALPGEDQLTIKGLTQ
jgi:hypothetical protein